MEQNQTGNIHARTADLHLFNCNVVLNFMFTIPFTLPTVGSVRCGANYYWPLWPDREILDAKLHVPNYLHL